MAKVKPATDYQAEVLFRLSTISSEDDELIEIFIDPGAKGSMVRDRVRLDLAGVLDDNMRKLLKTYEMAGLTTEQAAKVLFYTMAYFNDGQGKGM